MKVVVCLKQILDPELPPSVFQIDRASKRAVLAEHPLVVSPFDENALELALQLRDKAKECRVAALTYGPPKSEEAVRKALGVLADEAVMVIQEGEPADSYATARVLAAAIRKMGPVDLVMCGRQAGDWDSGQVGLFLAEELGWPSVSFAAKMELAGGLLRLHSEVEGGWEVLESPLPAVVTVTNDENNLLRVAKIKDVMAAHRKTVVRWTAGELGLGPDQTGLRQAYREMRDLFIPVYENNCEIIEGEDPAEKVAILVEKMKDLKVL